MHIEGEKNHNAGRRTEITKTVQKKLSIHEAGESPRDRDQLVDLITADFPFLSLALL